MRQMGNIQDKIGAIISNIIKSLSFIIKKKRAGCFIDCFMLTTFWPHSVVEVESLGFQKTSVVVIEVLSNRGHTDGVGKTIFPFIKL